MTATYPAPVQNNRSHTGLRWALRGMLSIISAAPNRLQVARSHPEWYELNDHLLRDIGKSRAEAQIARACEGMGIEGLQVCHSAALLQREIAAAQRSRWSL